MNITTHSHSSVALWLECRRKWAHRYIEEMEPARTPHYFVGGRAGHRGVERLLQTNGNLALALRAVNAEFQLTTEGPYAGILTAEEVNELEASRKLILGAVQAHEQTHGAADRERFTELMLEERCLGESGLKLWSDDETTAYYTGIIDVLAKDADGWWIIDHKFLAKLPQHEALYLDAQLIGYMHLAQKILGEWPVGVIYNVVRKPGIRQRKSRKPETDDQYHKRLVEELLTPEKEHVRRYDVRFSAEQVDLWWKELVGLTREIHQATVWGKTSAACSGKYSACAFIDPCRFGEYGPNFRKKTHR